MHRERRSAIVIAIHGGAGGTIPPNIPDDLAEAYRARLRDALKSGYAVLEHGGSALDATCEAVRYMEDSPLFNAAKGAVFNRAGRVECEASVMLAGPTPILSQSQDGENKRSAKDEKAFDDIPPTRRCAAVTLVRNTKNPILLARALYLNPDDAPHVLLSGTEAEKIGWANGCKRVDERYFHTRRRWLEHRRGLGLPDDDPPIPNSLPSYASITHNVDEHLLSSAGTFDPRTLPQGTVGAVALDQHGRLAVATSTGGKTNKNPGRIGDTPSVGAGFWAEVWPASPKPTLSALPVRSKPRWLPRIITRLLLALLPSSSTSSPSSSSKSVNDHPPSRDISGLAISGTGDGDYFLRVSFASLIAHRMRFLNETAVQAGEAAVKELGCAGGVGGAVVLDRQGNVSFPLNSTTMNRGYISSDTGAVPRVALFADEECE